MKTTIDLPDDIFVKAKLLAAERQTTLKDIMIQALQKFASIPTEDDEKERKATMRRLLKAMRASNTDPMVPLKREEIYER